MTRFLVMPRGINVGANNRVPMGPLREILAQHGFADVQTVLQSGNILVTAEDNWDAQRVGTETSALLKNHWNVQAPCVVRSALDIARVLALNPLRDMAAEGSKYLVTFLSQRPSAATAQAFLQDECTEPSTVHLDNQEVYIWAPEGVLKLKPSLLALDKRFDCITTTRNWNTLERISRKI